MTRLTERVGAPTASDTQIFTFDHDHGVPARDLVDLLGGKGAGLAEMTGALGIQVPPGFTISLPVCRQYRDSGWPDGLETELARHIDALGARMGRRFGDENDPLLVAVRSGAPVSMPGMLDTVLNLGLNDQTVQGLARVSGDEWFAWDSYRRFLRMFATTVMDVPEANLHLGEPGDTAEHSRAHVADLKAAIAEAAGRPVPTDPAEQLREAVEAVFRSWDCARARVYRAKEGIDEQIGTAVNVQTMVFGNRGLQSGTGVVFTRDPATGQPGLYGDYLPCAQGEDVVAGIASTLPVTRLGELLPGPYAQLLEVLRRLEVHYRDICDVEFTVEDGRLWLLQTRVGQRGAVAAVRAAVDFVNDPDIRLTHQEAVSRVPADLRERARQEVLSRVSGSGAADDLLATGLGASPGRVSGRIVLSSEDAADSDDDVILVRNETSPEDIAGMAASVGVLTTKGGLVSHAAVVARGWGIPAVVGAHDLWITDGVVRSTDGLAVRAGDSITIDGTTGQVWRGVLAAAPDHVKHLVTVELPELAQLETWASQYETPTPTKVTSTVQ